MLTLRESRRPDRCRNGSAGGGGYGRADHLRHVQSGGQTNAADRRKADLENEKMNPSRWLSRLHFHALLQSRFFAHA